MSMGDKQAIVKYRESRKINQSHCTNIGHSQYNNLEGPEEEVTDLQQEEYGIKAAVND